LIVGVLAVKFNRQVVILMTAAYLEDARGAAGIREALRVRSRRDNLDRYVLAAALMLSRNSRFSS
jgi:hypothetical protein